MNSGNSRIDRSPNSPGLDEFKKKRHKLSVLFAGIFSQWIMTSIAFVLYYTLASYQMPIPVLYKLNLRGPSISMQTACSTSLVNIVLASQGLLGGACDIALAGGSTVSVPDKSGYLYEDGMILSPDGHCRAFDEQAAGTVFGDGVGVVVLKRLSDAIADGDVIHAVIKGFGLNNDGTRKVGFTAPSTKGQAEVIDARRLLFVAAGGTPVAGRSSA